MPFATPLIGLDFAVIGAYFALVLGVAALIAFGALFVAGLGGAFEANKLLMALFGVPIVIPSVFGILWKTPNTKGVYLCLAAGILSGLCVKFAWPSLSWESGTFIQLGVCFAAYFAGTLFGTSKREAETKAALFKELRAATDGDVRCPGFAAGQLTFPSVGD